MPTQITIENLANGTVKPCPFEEGQAIKAKEFYSLRNDGLLDYNLQKYIYDTLLMFGFCSESIFKMPDGYYHLPPDKQLGLPLGKWTTKQVREVCSTLPYGTVIQYFYNKTIATCGSWRGLEPSDFRNDNEVVEIKEQPPNLYCPPINQQAEAVPAQPAKETEKMALPWQDISTLDDTPPEGMIALYKPKRLCRNGELEGVYIWAKDLLVYTNRFTHWFPITPPEAPTVEVPVEPLFPEPPKAPKYLYPLVESDISDPLKYVAFSGGETSTKIEIPFYPSLNYRLKVITDIYDKDKNKLHLAWIEVWKDDELVERKNTWWYGTAPKYAEIQVSDINKRIKKDITDFISGKNIQLG